VTEPAAPGRSCPLHYHYGPTAFKRDAPAHLNALDVLYVVGGLYGNLPALHRVLRLFERERGNKRLLFNGDFHWFDADPGTFEQVQREVLGFDALRGNVETELAGDNNDAGCGCAYPDWVGDGVVERSNRILARLRGASTPAQRQQLAALPMWQRADVGPLRLGLVHGDAQSLAGWGFAAESLLEPAARAQARRWFEQAQVHAFACTHTCLPLMQRLHTEGGPRWVLNNGAAGMPNFRHDRAGLITRIALHPHRGPERRYGVSLQGVFLEALAIEHDTAAFERQFLASWPQGSDAFVSYFQRIQQGPDYAPVQAVRDDVPQAHIRTESPCVG
jgi:hypothetical protein